MKGTRFTRRAFLQLSALTGAGALLSACAKPTPVPTKAAIPPTAVVAQPTIAPTKPPTVAPTAAPKAAVYKESPMLAELVKAGKLPPIEQRLPKDPLVVKPFEKIGKHGGTLNMVDCETGLGPTVKLRLSSLFHWNKEGTSPVADIAKGFKWSTDLKTLTLELREGHKWSNGEPFTVDDILFWWEDIQLNKDLTPVPPVFWTPGGKPAVFKKISPTVLEISFSEPYAVAMDWLARGLSSRDPGFGAPMHYLKKWHIKYNPKADDLAKEEKLEKWTQAFRLHLNPGGELFNEVGRPTLYTWIPEQITAERAIGVRNPYFHQVDPEGNQLPYVDRINVARVTDREIVALKASSGELDLEMYAIDVSNMAVFKQNQQRGDYRILTCQEYRPSAALYGFNRTAKDPVLKDLFNKKDFRIALSIAINRKAINDAVFFGLATPSAITPHPNMSFFKKEWTTRYIEYDLPRANQLLDSLGLTKKDSDGYRLRPDGQGRLSLLVELYWPGESPKDKISELVVSDWRKVGIEAVAKVPNITLLLNREVANETQVMCSHADCSGLWGRTFTRQFGFVTTSGQFWGTQWAIWLRGDGKVGIEPPEDIKKADALFLQYQRTLPDTPEFNKLGGEYYEWFSQEFPVIGTVGFQTRPMIVKNKLRNVPGGEGWWWGADTDFYCPFMPSQWYFES